MSKLITIGLPVYNGMPYLPEALDSLLAQSYRDFEILAIDDGSTDDSLAYLGSVRDSRLRVLPQEHRGLSSTLNRMLAEVRTPWLARHDADDVAYPHRLARTVDFIRRYPDAGMFHSLADYYPHDRCLGRFRSTCGTPKEMAEITREGYLLCICHPTVTLNVSKAIRVGGYRFNLYVEDIDLWWRMALGYEIRLIPEATIGFRQNLASESARNLREQANNTGYIQYRLLSHLWRKSPLPFDFVRGILATLADDRQLRFKCHLRALNINLARGRYMAAAASSVSALCTSPNHFLQRVLYETTDHQLPHLGSDPKIFRELSEELWPIACDSTMQKRLSPGKKDVTSPSLAS